MLSKTRTTVVLTILFFLVLGLAACSDGEGTKVAKYGFENSPEYLKKDQDQWYGIFLKDASDTSYSFCVGEDPGNMEQKYASTETLDRIDHLEISGGNAAWVELDQGEWTQTLKYYDGANGMVVDVLADIDTDDAKSLNPYCIALDERYMAWQNDYILRKNRQLSIQCYDNKTKEVTTLYRGKVGEYCNREMYLHAGKLYFMVEDSTADTIVIYVGDLTKGTTEVVAKETNVNALADYVYNRVAFFMQGESIVYEIPNVHDGDNTESEIIVYDLATAAQQRYPLPKDANCDYRIMMCYNSDSLMVEYYDRKDKDICHLAILEYGDTKLTPFYSYRCSGDDDPYIQLGDMALLEDQAVWIEVGVPGEFDISPPKATLRVYDFENETLTEVYDAYDYITDGENLYYLKHQPIGGTRLELYH